MANNFAEINLINELGLLVGESGCSNNLFTSSSVVSQERSNC